MLSALRSISHVCYIMFLLWLCLVQSSINRIFNLCHKIKARLFMRLWRELLTVPVQSVRLTSKDLDNTQAVVYADAQPVVFNEGELRHLYCDVIGSFPEPRVSIFIEDLDVTSHFTKTVQLVRDTGSRDLSYHVTLANEEFSVGSVTFFCKLELQVFW